MINVLQFNIAQKVLNKKCLHGGADLPARSTGRRSAPPCTPAHPNQEGPPLPHDASWNPLLQVLGSQMGILFNESSFCGAPRCSNPLPVISDKCTTLNALQSAVTGLATCGLGLSTCSFGASRPTRRLVVTFTRPTLYFFLRLLWRDLSC